MDEWYVGVLAVITIAGMKEAARRLGLGAAYTAPLAVALGLLLSLGHLVAADIPGAGAWLDAVLRGVALGLSAAGLQAGLRCRRDDHGPVEQRR